MNEHGKVPVPHRTSCRLIAAEHLAGGRLRLCWKGIWEPSFSHIIIIPIFRVCYDTAQSIASFSINLLKSEYHWFAISSLVPPLTDPSLRQSQASQVKIDFCFRPVEVVGVDVVVAPILICTAVGVISLTQKRIRRPATRTRHL